MPVRGVSTDNAVAMTLDAIERRYELAQAIQPGILVAMTRLDVYMDQLKQQIAAVYENDEATPTAKTDTA